eukprot:6909217-Alexandrium_andersonii.AAC.1
MTEASLGRREPERDPARAGRQDADSGEPEVADKLLGRGDNEEKQLPPERPQPNQQNCGPPGARRQRDPPTSRRPAALQVERED